MLIEDIRVDLGETPESPKFVMDGCGLSASLNRAETLTKAIRGVHDRTVANDLGFASAWAYSDLGTFARAMCCHLRLEANEFVAVSDQNPALMGDSTAYLLQSADRKLAILAFRGTGPTNILNWVSDVTFHTELFLSEGSVHAGFNMGMNVLWRPLAALLATALKGGSICNASMFLKLGFRSVAVSPPAPNQFGTPAPVSDTDRLEALYITGHSLGGALAILMAARIFAEPLLLGLRDKLRGVYTYGQPMVGLADFAHSANKTFGKLVFRHVYKRDLVPRLPPFTAGRFVHIGEEYAATDQGWVYRSGLASQALTGLGAVLSGGIDFVAKELGGLPLSWLPLPFSVADHNPINYLRTCSLRAPGYEFA